MLYSSPHYRLSRVAPRAVRLVRTAQAFESMEQFVSAHEALITALEPLSGAILVDLREVKGRNDPAFEARMAAYRRRMFAPFERLVVLVGTAIGKLQVQRHMHEDGFTHALVSDSEPEALRHVQGQKSA
ncbi:MAG: hypothetical protein KF901_03700 [Myxococcales bacterium]|nr:hypothetical protein [Myxococcales bacterium]